MVAVEFQGGISVYEQLHPVLIIQQCLLGIAPAVQLLEPEPTNRLPLDIIHFKARARGLPMQEVQCLHCQQERQGDQEEEVGQDDHPEYRIEEHLFTQCADIFEQEVPLLGGCYDVSRAYAGVDVDDAGHQQVGEVAPYEDQVGVEPVVVADADAVIDPLAMMIMPINAPIANIAVP